MNNRFGNHFASLVDEISTRYKIGKRFAAAYLKRWEDPYSLPNGTQLHRLKDIHALPEPFPMWFDYAMTANQRGAAMADMLLPHAAKNARRYLDVGCGLGGFLVAFAQRRFDVRGFDLDNERVQLARLNLQDFGASSENAVYGDLLDDAFVAGLGRFDIITMIDVIEHVLNVPKALETLLTLLNPGGILLMEIPNPFSLSAIAQDGHFNLFGITLLNRPDAMSYHRLYFDFAYDVGDYYPLDFYQQWFQTHGCTSQLLFSGKRPLPPESALQPAIQSMLTQWGAYLSEHAAKLPADLNQRLMENVHGYFDGMLRERAALTNNTTMWNAFAQKYLLDFVLLLVRRT